MQTFLPYPDFVASARVLDRQRLGKQRIEAWMLLEVLTGGRFQNWRHHPIVAMWKGYAPALARYGLAMCAEWRRRGYRDTRAELFEAYLERADAPDRPPPWLGDARLHASHRANLLRKLPEHYGAFGWTEDPAMAYFWPDQRGGGRWARPALLLPEKAAGPPVATGGRRTGSQ